MSAPIQKIASLACIVARGRIASKSSIYELINALYKVDSKLPAGWPIQLHLEDLATDGQLGGEYELSSTIRVIKSRREVFVHAEDMCAGSAPMVALVCGSVRSANVPAVVGAFGDVRVLRDTSKKAETEGRKIHIVRAGAHKGAGTLGTPLTDEQLAELGRPTLEATELLLGELTAIRHWQTPQVAEIKSGRLFSGPDLIRLKLIQHFATAEQAFDNFVAALEKKYRVP